MNDFQRRLLDTSLTSVYLAEFAKNDPNVIDMDDFVYSSGAALLGLAPGVAAQDLIPIQSDSVFIVFYMSGSGVSLATGAATPTPPGKVQFTDTGSNRTYFNQPTQFANVLGSGGYPLLLPLPRIIQPNTNIKIDLTNTDPGVTYDYSISFIGVRVYYKS